MSTEENLNTITSQQDDKKENLSKKNKLTAREIIALIILATVDFLSFCGMTIMVLFYPTEAISKGMTESTAGFVFGFYALVAVLSSPVFGKFIIPTVGIKLSFILGILLSGVCSTIFGLLNMVNDCLLFTVLSFVIRGLEAFGASAYATAAYVIFANIFPDHFSTVRGFLEVFVGLGMCAGPAIGGFLFAVGGFGLPFYVIGLTSILIAPLNICLLPSFEKYSVEKKTGVFMELLKLPSVLVSCLIVIVVSSTWGFLYPTLEPHLVKFELDSAKIGFIFLARSGIYALCCFFWGWLSDVLKKFWWIMSVGLFCNFLSLMFVGPSPIFNFSRNSVELTVVSLCTLGISVAMVEMPTYRSVLDSAIVAGFTKNLSTHSIIAGLWASFYAMGEVIGPIAGSTLMDHYGFPVAASTFAIINLLTSIIATVFFLNRKTNTSQEKISETNVT